MTGTGLGRFRRAWAAGATCLAAVFAIVLAFAATGAQAAPSIASVTKIAANGLGKPNPLTTGPDAKNYGKNTYAWSMAWFHNKLYVGTGAHELCVEKAVADYYFPGQGKYKSGVAWHVYCPADKYDLQIQAEIWSYDPGPKKWTRVYESPTVPIPNVDLPAKDQNKGKTVARYVGFRGMTIQNDQLFAASVTPDEYLSGVDTNHKDYSFPKSNPPVLLRTGDGSHWTALPNTIGTVTNPFGTQYPSTWRSVVSFNGALYANTGGGLTGDGSVIRIDDANTSNPKYTQVTPSTMDVYELQVYNGSLYVGTADRNAGYGIYSSYGTAVGPFWKPVVVYGAGMMNLVNSVVSMSVYDGYLYVGASGWYAGSLPSSEMIRVHTDGTFDLIAGPSRSYYFKPGVKTTLAPLSGLGNGFGNPFTAHFWRFGSIDGGLYVTTNDWSWDLWNVPVLDKSVKDNFGFDLWGTCDGVHWQAVTQNAFGDGTFNFGGRTTQTTPDGKTMYIGSVNAVQGFSVWKTGNMMGCTSATAGANAAAANAAAASPTQLTAAAKNNGTTKVTWKASVGAQKYVVMRAAVTDQSVSTELPMTTPIGSELTAVGSGSLQSGKVAAAGDFSQVGTTTGTQFLDKATTNGASYVYKVYSVSAAGTSPSASVSISNTLNTTTLAASFTGAVANFTDAGALTTSGSAKVLDTLGAFKTALAKGDTAAAEKLAAELQVLVTADQAHGGVVLRAQAQDTLGTSASNYTDFALAQS